MLFLKSKKLLIVIIVAILILAPCSYAGASYYQSNKLIKEADKLADVGDYAGAVSKYDQAVKKWKWNDKKITPKKTSAVTNAAKKEEKNPPATAAWKTYTGSYEGISLKYPPTWKLTPFETSPTTRSDERRSSYGLSDWKGPFDGFTLTNQNGYIISYDTHIDRTGRESDAGANSPKTYYFNVFPLINSNYTNLQLIQAELRSQDNKTIQSRSVTLWNPQPNTATIPKTGDTIDGLFDGLYEDRGADKVMSQLGGGFKDGEVYKNLTTAQYFNLADVKEAVSILKTVTFK